MASTSSITAGAQAALDKANKKFPTPATSAPKATNEFSHTPYSLATKPATSSKPGELDVKQHNVDEYLKAYPNK